MDIYLNESMINIELNNLSKKNILNEITERIDNEIIETIYLDEVEVSLDYFKDNNIELDKLNEIKFITKKVSVLLKETQLEIKEYLPKLKTALFETAELYKQEKIEKAADKLNKCLDGLEWYTEVMNSIMNLTESKELAEHGKKLLNKFDNATTRAMIGLQNGNYQYLADIIEAEIVEYLSKLEELNDKLLSD